MSSRHSDEEFERRIRDVLNDRQLAVPPAPDALERVHSGAKRRQQRRSAGAVLGAVAIIGIAAAAVSLRPQSHSPNVVADHTASPSLTSASSVPPSSPVASADPKPFASNSVLLPSSSANVSAPSKNGFNAFSVSAVGVNDYWVLGAQTSGETSTTAVKQTNDGGKTFTIAGRIPAIVGSLTRAPAGTPTVSEIRFGDTRNGWAYGGSLFATADGGATWSAMTVPGKVVDLAAASGDVWAVVNAAENGKSAYSLFHAAYGASGTGAWTRIDLGTTPTETQPSLAVIKKTAYLLEGPASRQVTYIVTNGGGTYTTQPGPCRSSPTLDAGGLSVAGDGSLWAWCTAGHESALYVSSDATHWTSRLRTAITSAGGVDSTHAVVSDSASLAIVTIGKSDTTPAVPHAGIPSDVSFIGFTTTAIGFAVVNQQVGLSGSLWRTTDGGSTWSVVALGS